MHDSVLRLLFSFELRFVVGGWAAKVPVAVEDCLHRDLWPPIVESHHHSQLLLIRAFSQGSQFSLEGFDFFHDQFQRFPDRHVWSKQALVVWSHSLFPSSTFLKCEELREDHHVRPVFNILLLHI